MLSTFEVKNKIKDLSAAIVRIENKAQNEGRELNGEETSLIAQMEGSISQFQKELPGKPLTVQAFSGTSRSNGPFATFGEQMSAIVQAGIPGGRTDPRLYEIRGAATGLGETTPSEGGFLLQQDFNASLLQDVVKASVLAPLCRKVPIGSNSNSIKLPGVDETSRATGSRSGGVRGYWTDEASEKTASKPKFRSVELTLKKACCLVYSTDELLSDSVALESVVRTACTSELSFMLDDAIVNGTGVGQPLGILNAGSLVSVSKESGQAASTINIENIVKMESRMIGTGETAVWLAGKSTKSQLYTLSLSSGTGGTPVYMPPGGLSARPFDTLLGKRVIFVEQAAALGTIGDIVYCDFQNGYILAEKGGIESAMSIHVRFIYDESVFRFVLRVDGQPVRASALTPYKGSDTESHFIALETRS